MSDLSDYNETDQEGIISWAVYSMRDTVAEENIRNNFLEKTGIKEFGKEKGFNIKIERTLAQASKREISSFLSTLLNKTEENDIVLFTISNRQDKATNETHFQSFVLVAKSRTIFAFDPARKKAPEMSMHNLSKEEAKQYFGIYGDYAIDDVFKFIKTYNEKSSIQYEVKYAPVKNTCQIDETEVFCQSWSLYLQYKFLEVISYPSI